MNVLEILSCFGNILTQYGDVLLQVGTVFLGAFLAFWLENLRERRNLRKWANKYLKLDREDIDLEDARQSIAGLEKVVEGYDACINQKRVTYSLREPLMSFSMNLSENYSIILNSEAVPTLPTEVVNKLHVVSKHLRVDKELSSICFALQQQYAVPIFLEEHELTEREIQSLSYITQLFAHRVASMKKVLELEHELLELLDQHNLGR